MRERKFINSFQFLFFTSILLEIFHYFIPNRAFEYYDLFANFTGVHCCVFIYSTYFKNKNEEI